MGKCPSCGKEIEYLEGAWRETIMGEIYWDGEDFDFVEQEREVEDETVLLLCPLCGEEVGHSEADAKKILKS